MHEVTGSLDTEPGCSNERLLAKAAAGNTAAFAEIYNRFSPAVYGLAKRIVRNDAIAREVAQEALLGVWSTCRTFDASRGSAQAWILTIAHRRSVDAVRREQSQHDRRERAAAWLLNPSYDVVSETAIENVTGQQIRSTLHSLTPCRERLSIWPTSAASPTPRLRRSWRSPSARPSRASTARCVDCARSWATNYRPHRCPAGASSRSRLPTTGVSHH